MRGQITSYDALTNTGVIKAEDQTNFVFARHDIHTGSEVKEGQVVDFVPTGSTATLIVILFDAPQTESQPQSAAQTYAAVTSLNAFDFKTAMLKFDGRLSRQNFWIGFAIVYGASLVIVCGASLVLSIIPIVNMIAPFALIWPNLAITVKRLHDMGKSGWLAAIPIVSGTIAAIASIIVLLVTILAVYGDETNTGVLGVIVPAMVLIGIIALINIGFLIWIGATDSQRGPNQYGPNPKGV